MAAPSPSQDVSTDEERPLRLAKEGFWVATAIDTIRFAARVLPPGILALFLAAPALAVVTSRIRAKKGGYKDWRRLPVALRGGRRNLPLPKYLLRRTMLLTNKAMYLWPDRLREPKWARRIELEGRENLELIRSIERPVILVGLHYGPSSLIYHWFRAQSIPFTGLVGRDLNEENPTRQRLDTLADAANNLSHVRRLYCPADLWHAHTVLHPGVMLGTALDVPQKSYVVGETKGCQLLMARGVFKLARMVDATILPCIATTEGWLRSRITLGTPVPAEDWKSRAEASIHGDLCEFFVSVIREKPDLCEYLLLVHLKGR